MRSINDVSLLDILPPSLTTDEQVKAAAQAIDAELLKVTQQLNKLTLMENIDSLDGAWVDELAWQFHVDFYDTSLPIDIRRSLVKNSLAWHRRKGTGSAVEELISSTFGDGVVEEWFDYGGQPFHFRVSTTNPAATNEQADEFVRAINSVKRLTAILDSISISSTVSMPVYYGFAIHTGDNLTLRQVV